MRKPLRSAVIAGAALLMLAASPSWAAPGGQPGANPEAPGQLKKVDAPGQIKKNEPRYDAPEIDVGAGGAGITVLVIALLLALERRSRTS